jgi:hypothetical protein
LIIGRVGGQETRDPLPEGRSECWTLRTPRNACRYALSGPGGKGGEIYHRKVNRAGFPE